MKQVYSFETSFMTFADEMSAYLKLHNIRYERSGCFGGYYFSIEATQEEAENINRFIDDNTITCQ